MSNLVAHQSIPSPSVASVAIPSDVTPYARGGGDDIEFTLLARQTHALEYIASQLGALTGHSIVLPAEMHPDFETARRRLLEEAV